MSRSAQKIGLLITRGDILGGAQIHLLDLAHGLRDRGDEVLVMVGSTGLMTNQLEQSGIPVLVVPSLVRSMNPLHDRRAWREIRAILRREKPHILSTHTAKAGLVGRLAARSENIPVVFTAHGWQFAPGIPLRQRLFVYLCECLFSRIGRHQAVICVSAYDEQLARRTRAVPRRRLHCIHNGIPDTPAVPDQRVSDARDGKVCRLIMPARFERQKDHSTLLRAMASIPSLNWELVLPGEGTTLSECRKLAARIGIPAERISFPGHCQDLAERLPDFDIFLLISHWEGLPLSIIEAMRTGLPVIATDVGGVRELIKDGENGFLIGHQDTSHLTEKLTFLMQNPEVRRRMGKAGRKTYEKHFQLQFMLDQTFALWDQLVLAHAKSTA